MERRRLGQTGLEVSALGFGCGAVGGLMVRGERSEQVRGVALALEAGMNYFDTAPSYGDGASEESLGRALRELRAERDVVVGTKVRLEAGDLAAPRAAVRRSLEASLARLGRESVDVVHLHNRIGAPPPGGNDTSVSMEAALGEVAEALSDVVEAGLAAHAGFTGVGETGALHAMLDHDAYETVQAYLNVLNPSGVRAGASGGAQDFEGLVVQAASRGVGVLAIRVLAAGALSGTEERHPLAGPPPRPLLPGAAYHEDVARARALVAVAAEMGLESTLELAVRFALSAPGVSTALIGLSTVEYLESALGWARRGPLPASAMERLLGLASAQRVDS